jgi:hypothetical protein
MLSVPDRRTAAAPLRIALALLAVAAIALTACGGDDDGTDALATPTVRAGFTPPPTLEPIPTFDFRTSTPGPADFVAVVTMDTDPATPAIDHQDISAAVGASFPIGIIINRAPQPFRGYQVALGWPDNGIIAYSGEEALMPQNMTICSPIAAYLPNTLPAGQGGIYGGCLNPDGAISHEGLVTTITLSCAQAGEVDVRTLSVAEAASLGTSLITEQGTSFAEELDHGITVTCN